MSKTLLITSVLTGFFLVLATTPVEAATCTVPNLIANGQVSDASKIMDNFNAVANCAQQGVTTSGSPSSGSLSVFSGTGVVTNGDLNGDVTTSGGTTATLANSGVVPGTYSNSSITVDAKGRVTAAASGSGGGGGTILFAGSNTTINYDPGTSAVALDSCTVNIPSSAVPRNFLVNAYLQFSHSTHGVRTHIYLDSSAVTIDQNWAADGDGTANFSQFGPLQVSVPGDGNPHTISIYVEDSGATGNVSFYSRGITAQPLQ